MTHVRKTALFTLFSQGCLTNVTRAISARARRRSIFGDPTPVAPLPRISQLLTPRPPPPLSSRPPGYVSFLHKAERAVSSIAR